MEVIAMGEMHGGATADPSYDVVVVGAGAGGLNAALVLARSRRRVAVVDAGEQRNAPASHVRGFSSRDGTPPAHDRLCGIELADGKVVARSTVFVFPQMVPRDALLTDLGCERDGSGWV